MGLICKLCGAKDGNESSSTTLQAPPPAPALHYHRPRHRLPPVPLLVVCPVIGRAHAMLQRFCNQAGSTDVQLHPQQLLRLGQHVCRARDNSGGGEAGRRKASRLQRLVGRAAVMCMQVAVRMHAGASLQVAHPLCTVQTLG